MMPAAIGSNPSNRQPSSLASGERWLGLVSALANSPLSAPCHSTPTRAGTSLAALGGGGSGRLWSRLSFRRLVFDGQVSLPGTEPHLPCSRPLSKGIPVR